MPGSPAGVRHTSARRMHAPARPLLRTNPTRAVSSVRATSFWSRIRAGDLEVLDELELLAGRPRCSTGSYWPPPCRSSHGQHVRRRRVDVDEAPLGPRELLSMGRHAGVARVQRDRVRRRHGGARRAGRDRRRAAAAPSRRRASPGSTAPRPSRPSILSSLRPPRLAGPPRPADLEPTPPVRSVPSEEEDDVEAHRQLAVAGPIVVRDA